MIAQPRPIVGTRVRLTEAAERFPHFIAPKGAVGVVTVADDHLFAVKLDTHLDGCEEWDNEVCWVPEDDEGVTKDGVACMEFTTPPVKIDRSDFWVKYGEAKIIEQLYEAACAFNDPELYGSKEEEQSSESFFDDLYTLGWDNQSDSVFMDYALKATRPEMIDFARQRVLVALGLPIIATGQYYESRVFEPIGASESQIKAVVEAYIKGMEEQTGLVGEFATLNKFTVDMSNWPEGEGFGDWFEALMQEHKVEVWD